VGRHVDRRGERLRKTLEAAVVFPGLGDFIELALRILDLGGRCEVDRRVVRDVDHVLADEDQVATDRQVVDGTTVVLRIDDRGRFRGQSREILTGIEAGNVEVCGEERLQRDRARDLPLSHQAAGQFINLVVQGLEEMPWLEEI
jgi:hypothetical protein